LNIRLERKTETL